jgi:TPR repeat protein
MRPNHDLQRLFDRQRYPLDIQQQDLFDQTCAKTHHGEFDNDSLSTLIALATNNDNPHVPSIQVLAKKAILEKDPQAFDLTLHGAMRGDQRCMLSHASLLTNPEFGSQNSMLDETQRELIAHQLLFTAKKTMQPLITVKNNSFKIDNSLAIIAEGYYKDHTDVLCAMYHQKLDDLAQHDPEKLEQLKQEALATAFVPAGCYFIKKNAAHNDYHSLEQAIDWAQLVASRPEFYAYYGSNKAALSYLQQSGALAAIDTIAQQSAYPELQQRACMIMGVLGINELKSEEFDIPRARIIRGRTTKKYLEKAAESNPEALLMLLAFDDQEQVVGVCNKLIDGLSVLSPTRAHQAFDQIIKKLSHLPHEKKSEANKVKTKLFSSEHVAAYKKNLTGWQLYSLALEMVDAECIEYAVPTFADAFSKGHIRAGCKFLALTGIDQKKVVGILDDLFTKIDALDTAAHGELADDLQRALMNMAINTTDLAIHERVVGRLKNHRASFTAFNNLYQNGKRKSVQHKEMANRYMQHALSTPDMVFKKQLIEYCMAHDDLVLLAAQELPALYTKNHNTQEAILLFDQALKTLIKKADEGDLKAAMASHAFLTTMPESYFDTIISDPKKLGEYYLDQAARQGYVPAINALKDSSTYNVVALNEEAFLKTATFFSSAINSCKPEQKNLKEVICQKLMAQCALVLGMDMGMADQRGKKGFENPDLCYHFVMGLGEWDERLAYLAFLKAEENACKQDKPKLFERIGCADYLKNLEKQGKGWASYARAISIFNRLPKNEKLEWRKPAEILKMVKEVQELIKKAKDAPVPYNGSQIQLGELDLINGVQLELIARDSKNKEIMAKAIAYFQESALKKFPPGLQKFGLVNLSGAAGKGQQFALRAIENLIEAARLGDKPSQNFLKDIYEQGFGYKFGCNGYITNEMRSMISAALLPINKPTDEQADPKENNAAHVQTNDSLYVQAIKNLESGNFALAYKQFIQEAAHVNVGAIAHMGIMQRDGLGVEQSLQAAKRSFITALLQWDYRQIHHYKILQGAAHCLDELFNQDFAARVATAKFALGCARTKLLIGMPLHDERSLLDLFSKINDTETMAFKSNSDEEKNRFYSSGLADSINEFCDASNDAQLLSIALLITRARMLELGRPKNNKDYEALAFPQKKLMGLLVNAVKGGKECALSQVTRETIETLSSTMEHEPVDHEFNAGIGMLHITGALQKMPWANLTRGIELLEVAAKNGNEEAALALAHMHLFCSKSSALFEKKKGKELLAQLAADYHNSNAMIQLAEILFEEDSFKEAEKYLTRAISIDPGNAKALYLLGHTLLYKPQTTPKDYREICNLLELGSVDEKFTQATRLIQAYLGLAHPEAFQENDPLRSEERLLDYLDQSLFDSLIKKEATGVAFANLCLELNFLKELEKWSQNIEQRFKVTQNDLDKNILARVYNSIAAANLIMLRNYIESGIPNMINATLPWEYVCKIKNLNLSKKSSFMTAIEIITDVSTNTTDKKLPERVLKILTRACEELKKQNLRLQNCPQLQVALSDVKEVVALIAKMEKAGKNRISLLRQGIDKLIEKYY